MNHENMIPSLQVQYLPVKARTGSREVRDLLSCELFQKVLLVDNGAVTKRVGEAEACYESKKY